MDNNDLNENLIDDSEEATIGMKEIDAFDFARAAMLMDVMAKCATIGVKCNSLGGIAAAALNEMNEEAKEIARRRMEEFAKAEADARAKVEAERKAAEDEEAEANLRAQQDAEDDAGLAAKPRAIPAQRPAPAPAPDRRV